MRTLERMAAVKRNYELLDFGDGRKLERFGAVVLNRPCPAAEGIAKSLPDLWPEATARFRGPRTGDGSWAPNRKLWTPAEWHFVHDGRRLVSFATRGAAFRTGWRVSGATRELGLDAASGRSLNFACGVGPGAGATAGIKPVCVHGREHVGRGRGRGRGCSHRCGPQYGRSGPPECGAFRVRRPIDPLDPGRCAEVSASVK